MDLSIIIVTRNTRAMTCDCIRSALAGRGRLSVEAVVVDNGSSDGTAEAVEAEFPEVRVIRSPNNLGFARAVNWGAASAPCDLLLLLNSDTLLFEDSLERAVEWMRGDVRCAVLGARLLARDGSPQTSIVRFPSLATELVGRSVLQRLFPRRYARKISVDGAPMEADSVVGAFFLIRREAWEALGGLDERFFFYFEETDFSFRAHAAGWRVMHVPSVRVTHLGGSTAKTMSWEATLELWRARYSYFRKHLGRVAVGVLAVGLLSRLLVNWVYSTLAVTVTLGRNARWRGKWRSQTAVWSWHLRGLPPDDGLPR
jgi:GT2 family glycosyltransferase